MTYQYRARDPLGKIHHGSIEAPSLDEASQQLRRDGLQILELDEEDEAGLSLFGGRVSKSEVIYTTSQLAIMVDTGITLSDALAGIIEQEQNPTLRNILADLKGSVEAGEDLSTALARHPKLFDKTYVTLVRASEATGSLGPMLERITAYLRKELETRSRVRAAMAYPTVMMCLALGVTIFLLTYILPKFLPLFQSKRMELPGPTKVMVSVSTAVTTYWYVWAAALVAAIVGYVLARNTPLGRQLLDRAKLSLPVVGPVYRKVIISRSIRTLATMLQSGVPVLDAIRLCGGVSNNALYEALWEKVRSEVETGKRVCEVLAHSPLFPRVLVQMISSGEETGRLDYVLERVSNYYDQEVDTAIKTATSLIEPVMIAVMGVVVGGIGMALLLPIFSLSRQP